MSAHYHRLLEFFKELKRRKVIRVITVYAASAFVILELVDILAPSLNLPEWTLNLVLLLLCVGFVIAVIVSWLFDIHPEEGIVKTKPIKEGKVEEAEDYMEERRQDFWENGYLIRKLNQAYFAFYRAYNDDPGGGAAGADPVGPAVQAFRDKFVNLADFLRAISWVDSFDELKRSLEV